MQGKLMSLFAKVLYFDRNENELEKTSAHDFACKTCKQKK